jgi:DNA-binding response OmpR family regulator
MIKLLLVDDDPVLLESLTLAFNTIDYEVKVANNGESALRIIDLYIFDLIILDWKMPKMDGIELTKLLKENENTYEIPIVMLTGQTGEEDLKEAFDSGINDFIKKPFNTIEITSKVNAMINHQQLLKSHQELKLQSLQSENLNLSHQLLEKEEHSKHIEVQNSKQFTNVQNLVSKLNKLEELQTKYNYAVSDIKNELNAIISEVQSPNSTLIRANSILSEKLRLECKSLSEAELRICILISLDLSNRDIASQLFISTRTVENHKYHIRKKLNLSKETGLKLFIKEIENNYF